MRDGDNRKYAYAAYLFNLNVNLRSKDMATFSTVILNTTGATRGTGTLNGTQGVLGAIGSQFDIPQNNLAEDYDKALAEMVKKPGDAATLSVLQEVQGSVVGLINTRGKSVAMARDLYSAMLQNM